MLSDCEKPDVAKDCNYGSQLGPLSRFQQFFSGDAVQIEHSSNFVFLSKS